jgi:hypothetical protein
MVVSRPKPVRQLCFAMSLKLKGQHPRFENGRAGKAGTTFKRHRKRCRRM